MADITKLKVKTPSLLPFKDVLKKMNKVLTLYLCQVCNNYIKPFDGCIVKGNVYVADPDCMGGIIGDNFPKKDYCPQKNIKIEQVYSSIFCTPCLAKVLSVSPQEQVKKRGIVKICYCNNCNSPIVQPENGFLIQGNIYFANFNEQIGIIGNNFPSGEFNINDVSLDILCKKCLFKLINKTREKYVSKNLL